MCELCLWNAEPMDGLIPNFSGSAQGTIVKEALPVIDLNTYKLAIRILKRLRDRMQESGIAAASNIGSFLIESLTWNVPNEQFERDTHRAVMRAVLAHTFNNTITDEKCADWGE